MWIWTKTMHLTAVLSVLFTSFTSLVFSTDVDHEDSEEVGDPMMLEMYDQQMRETFGELNLGKEYYEGDILLSKEQRAFLQNFWQNDRTQIGDLPVNDVRKWWPNNTVPYIIGKGLRAMSLINIHSAIWEWQENVCITFKERQDEKDYIEFVYEGGCASRIGRVGGRQIISVGSAGTEHTDHSCGSFTPYGSNVTITCTKGNIMHEIGHALGFHHQHSRRDRDQYVEVLWGNVMQGCRVHFRKDNLINVDPMNGDYDYKSVMHYGPFFFARERGLRTLRPKTKGVVIGQRETLSELDVKQGRLMYQCDEQSNEANR